MQSVAASNPKCCSKGAVTIRAAQWHSPSLRWPSSHAAKSGDGSGENLVEEMTSGAVLHLEDPGVGVEAQFSREAFLDLSLGSRFFAEAAAEQPVRWTRIVEHTLGRGAEQFRRAV